MRHIAASTEAFVCRPARERIVAGMWLAAPANHDCGFDHGHTEYHALTALPHLAVSRKLHHYWFLEIHAEISTRRCERPPPGSRVGHTSPSRVFALAGHASWIHCVAGLLPVDAIGFPPPMSEVVRSQPRRAFATTVEAVDHRTRCSLGAKPNDVIRHVAVKTKRFPRIAPLNSPQLSARSRQRVIPGRRISAWLLEDLEVSDR